jgi:hypothetical protein
VGWLTTQFCLLDFEIARQHCPDLGYGYSQTLTAVWRATDDIKQFGFADIDFGDTQFIGIRMLLTGNNFTHYDIAEFTGNGTDAVHFQTSHSDLIGQLIGAERGLDPLIYPGFTEFHLLAPVLT